MTIRTDTLRAIFNTSTKVWVLYSALSLLGLFFGSLDIISGRFPEATLVTKTSLAYQLDQLSLSPIANNLVLVLFWGGLAMVISVFIWAVTNVGIEARNELVMELEYTNKGSMYEQFKAPLAQIGLGLVLLSLLWMSGVAIVPFLLTQFRHFLTLSPQFLAFAMLMLILVVTTILMYLLVVITRAFFLAA